MKFKTAKTNEYQRSSDIDRSRLTERNNISYLDRLVYRFKVILLGDYCVGKTSIINRYVEDVYSGDYNCTLGVEFKIKSLYFDDKTGVDLQIWDTCGHDKYRGITKQYFRDKNGAILVFDITNRKTFEAIKTWLDDIKNYGPQNTQIIVIGNKLDKSYQRDISFEEAKNFCDQMDLLYIEVSALNGKNINDIFDNLSKLMIGIEEEKNKYKINKSSSKIRLNKSYNKSITIDRSKDNTFEEIVEQEEKRNKCC